MKIGSSSEWCLTLDTEYLCDKRTQEHDCAGVSGTESPLVSVSGNAFKHCKFKESFPALECRENKSCRILCPQGLRQSKAFPSMFSWNIAHSFPQ